MNNKQLSDAEVNSSGLLKIDKPNVLNDKKTDNSNQLNNRPRQNMAQQNLSKGGQKPRQQQNNDLKQTDALIKPPKDNAQQQSSGKKSEIKQKVFGALPDKKSKLKVIFLGGVGEIGKNLTAFEYNDSIVIIDAGIAFPSADMPGVDVVIPDYTYLVENKRKIKAILLTHGHEDHIGGVPFLVKKLGIKKLPLFGSKLTLGLVENKLLEHNCLDLVSFNTIDDRSVVNFGEFVAEFIHVSHSVAGSVAICLRTPVGIIFHTGDFKIDYTPLGGEIMNLNRIAEIGKQNVLLLMSESTNVERPGYTMSESVITDTMNKLFTDNKGKRIIIATFASNVDRLMQIINLAKLHKRKVAISGRSMNTCIETAGRVGQFNVDKDIFIDIDKINNVPDERLLILSTGSQGEPMSALTRMANGEFNKVKIGSNDTIIISASPIPGNERDIYNVINNLYRLGASVIYSALADVHVSGHACQEELKLIYTLLKPKFFIPIHGEYRHLKQHAMLAEKLGQKPQNIIIPEIGDCVSVNQAGIEITSHVQSGNVMVDGLGVGDVGNIVLKDRLAMAEDGIVIVSVGLDTLSGKIIKEPEIVSRGCIYAGEDGSNKTLEELKYQLSSGLKQPDLSELNANSLKNAILRVVKNYFRLTFKRNPMVIPIVMEI